MSAWEESADDFFLPDPPSKPRMQSTPPPQKSSGPWRFVVIGCGTMSLIGMCLFGIAVVRMYTLVQQVRDAAENGKDLRGTESGPTTGSTRFHAADSLISVNRGVVAFGNTPRAIERAKLFEVAIAKVYEDSFTKRGRRPFISTSKGQFLTYCHIEGENCVVLFHVPELRRIDADGKKLLADTAWLSAAMLITRANLNPPPTKLAVGMRGAFLYDRVLVGKLLSAEETERFEAEDWVGLVENEYLGVTSTNHLITFFEPPPPVDIWSPQPLTPADEPRQPEGKSETEAKPESGASETSGTP